MDPISKTSKSIAKYAPMFKELFGVDLFLDVADYTIDLEGHVQHILDTDDRVSKMIEESVLPEEEALAILKSGMYDEFRKNANDASKGYLMKAGNAFRPHTVFINTDRLALRSFSEADLNLALLHEMAHMLGYDMAGIERGLIAKSNYDRNCFGIVNEGFAELISLDYLTPEIGDPNITQTADERRKILLEIGEAMIARATPQDVVEFINYSQTHKLVGYTYMRTVNLSSGLDEVLDRLRNPPKLHEYFKAKETVEALTDQTE